MLAIPSYAFGVVADNWSAGTPTSTPGTVLDDPGATPHTKSATTALIGTGIAQSAYFIQVGFIGTAAAGTDTSALCDIMYDPAGGTSWSVLIPNLICGYRAAAAVNLTAASSAYGFPLYIPKGSSLGARWQSIVASPSAGTRVRVQLTVFGGASAPGFWYGTKVTDVGTDTATSAGLDHTPGSTGTYSTWASIGGGSNPAFGFVTAGVQGSATAHTADNYHLQYGFGSTQIPGAQIRLGYTTAEIVSDYPPHMGCYVDVAASTQMQIRATGTDASAEVCSVALYGVS